MGKTLGDLYEKADALLQSMQYVDSLPRNRRQQRGGGNPGGVPATVTVRVTSSSPNASGYYPGVVTVKNTTTGAWTDLGGVSLISRNGDALYNGRRYGAVPAGIDPTDGKTPAFLADTVPAFASVVNVCPAFATISGVQVVTAITVEYLDPEGVVACVTNPVGCCASGGGDTNCCSLGDLCLTASGLTGSLACINGSYVLTTTSGSTFWSAPFSCGIYTNLQWVVQCWQGLGYHMALGNNWSDQTQSFQTTLTWQPAQPVDCSNFGATYSPIGIGGQQGCRVTVVPGDCSGGGTGGGACGITDTALGTAFATNVSSVSIVNVTVQPGLLIVNAAGVGAVPSSATFAGQAMTYQQSVSDANGNTVYQYSLHVATTTTGNIVVSTPSNPFSVVLVNAIEVQGLANNAPTVPSSGHGTSSQPKQNSYPTVQNCTFTASAFLLTTPGGSWTWASPLASGGQDVTSGIYSLTEGFVIEASALTLTPTLNGVTPAVWCGVSVSYY